MDSFGRKRLRLENDGAGMSYVSAIDVTVVQSRGLTATMRDEELHERGDESGLCLEACMETSWFDTFGLTLMDDVTELMFRRNKALLRSCNVEFQHRLRHIGARRSIFDIAYETFMDVPFVTSVEDKLVTIRIEKSFKSLANNVSLQAYVHIILNGHIWDRMWYAQSEQVRLVMTFTLSIASGLELPCLRLLSWQHGGVLSYGTCT